MVSNGYSPERKIIVADKLKDSITLSQVQVGSENNITSLKFDANRLTQEKQFQEIVISEKEKFTNP